MVIRMIPAQSAVTITPDQPLNAIISAYPQALPILQRFGLDTCCGGAIPLEVAAKHHGLVLAEILRALQSANAEDQQ